MRITNECACGALVSLPEQASGKRFRCRSCGLILRVPDGVDEGSVAVAEAEPSALAASRTWRRSVLGAAPTGIPEPCFDVPFCRTRIERRNDVTTDAGSFWGRALRAFGFFLNRSNLATFALICTLHGTLSGLLLVPGVGIPAWVTSILLSIWLCALYMNVITHTAADEDVLPSAELPHIDKNVLLPFQQFAACAAAALAPAGAVIWLAILFGSSIPWLLVAPLALLGLFVWPVILLWAARSDELEGESIGALVGAAFRPVAPHVWVVVVLGVAGMLTIATIMMELRVLTALLESSQPAISLVLLTLLGRLASTYLWIVASKHIGLRYAHLRRGAVQRTA